MNHLIYKFEFMKQVYESNIGNSYINRIYETLNFAVHSITQRKRELKKHRQREREGWMETEMELGKTREREREKQSDRQRQR